MTAPAIILIAWLAINAAFVGLMIRRANLREREIHNREAGEPNKTPAANS
ncbi:hypothetical protein [Novosphingobium sp.]|nr:hypothetical protein [Novosphingobium sp.]